MTNTQLEKVRQWWEAWGWQQLPDAALPPTRRMVNDCAAGFLYTTNSSIAWIEWITVDPKSDKLIRRKSLDELIKLLEQDAKGQGAEQIFIASLHPGLSARLDSHGYTRGDFMQHFVKDIS